MLRGHFAYFGIRGNSLRLGDLSYRARRCWRKWLSRRSRKCPLPWTAFRHLLARFPLPSPTLVQLLRPS
jgi:RNA-directed DNA polymerase